MAERTIGRVTHYFGHLGVAAVALTDALRVGDKIHVVGHTTDASMTVDRLQIEHQDVPIANPGDDVAVHVAEKVREHDEIRKIE